MTKITLPWMDKIREMLKDGMCDNDIVTAMMQYGESEERRINKAFKGEEDGKSNYS